jgi:hypothetical protein
MGGLKNYDQWKTSSPYDEHDDEHCFHCGFNLDSCDEKQQDCGFCCELCEKESQQKKPPLPVIRPLFDLLSHDLGENYETWSKRIYKGTDCGAWLRIIDNKTIEVGSIVEGSDVEIEPCSIVWPFTKEEFWFAVQMINDEACLEWEKANIQLED